MEVEPKPLRIRPSMDVSATPVSARWAASRVELAARPKKQGSGPVPCSLLLHFNHDMRVEHRQVARPALRVVGHAALFGETDQVVGLVVEEHPVAAFAALLHLDPGHVIERDMLRVAGDRAVPPAQLALRKQDDY